MKKQIISNIFFMKHFMLLMVLIVPFYTVDAQKLTVRAQPHVTLGDYFQVEYTVNTSNISENLTLGNIPKALELAYGPAVSTQQSYVNTNGRVHSSSSTTFTYTFLAQKQGTFVIPSASLYINGKTLKSSAVKVVVAGQSKSKYNSQAAVNDDNDNNLNSDLGNIRDKDLFIKVIPSKTSVYEQEPVTLTYKVYTLVELTQLNGKMPDLNGFHTQEIPLPQQKEFHIETINGRKYNCVTWSQYVMYPQMTGKLQIPSITFNGIVVRQNRNIDPFEAFFNGGSGYIESKVNIKAPSVNINVKPLPTKPNGFSGAVGTFNISAKIDKKEIIAGNPINIRVVIGGNGNLKLIEKPKINFPKDFEVYDAKVTDKTKLTTNGVEGNMIYDIMAVPSNQGNYTIPAFEFIYYDSKQNAYKTLKTQTFNINVLQGDGSNISIDDIRNKDILKIKEGDGDLSKKNDIFFFSWSYFLLLILPSILFVCIIMLLKKRIKNNLDVDRIKLKKAGKVAEKRLKKARLLMEKNQQEEFYDETLRALWGYVSDKLSMPVEQLSRDNVAEKLESIAIEQPIIKQFIEALEECEFQRYAPGDPKGNMNITFDAANGAITSIEEALTKQKKSGNKTMLFAIIILFSAFSTNISAQNNLKQSADSAYLKGNYQQAIKDYELILKNKESADVYYNLGNAYFRTENVTKAIINYERALLLSPGDENIKYNIQIANSKTIDYITAENELFLVSWYKAIRSFFGVDGWAIMSIILLISTFILVMLYLFSWNTNLRKLGFFGAIITTLCFILVNVFAYQQRDLLINRVGAVIISPSVAIKKTPTQLSENNLILHEGTKLTIIDDNIKGWKNVVTDDGREGWIENKYIEVI